MTLYTTTGGLIGLFLLGVTEKRKCILSGS
jgi:hypothetical protein